MTVTHKGLANDNPHRSGPRGLIRVVAPLETDLSRSKWILHPVTHMWKKCGQTPGQVRDRSSVRRTDDRTGPGQTICPPDRWSEMGLSGTCPAEWCQSGGFGSSVLPHVAVPVGASDVGGVYWDPIDQHPTSSA